MRINDRTKVQGEAVGEIVEHPEAAYLVRYDDIMDAAQMIFDSREGNHWVPGRTLELGSKRWRPTATDNVGTALLYVFLQQELPRHIRERLELAGNAKIAVTVALTLPSLYDSEIVELLIKIDAHVLVLDDYVESRRLVPRALLAAMADIGVPVSPELRRAIAKVVWERIESGTSYEKGQRLEALLAFFFSQVDDLKVVERNYRNASEEIDLVLQVDGFSSRVWQNPGVPFILVEAKNRADKASQQVISTMITKLQTKRGTARIAFVVSLAGFTEDARLQELRFSTQELCIVMIDRQQLKDILSAEDIDGALENFVRHALLR